MQTEKLMSLKALASELGVGYSFTRAMKKAGMALPGGRTSAAEAQRWLRKNPDFRVSDHFPTKPHGKQS